MKGLLNRIMKISELILFFNPKQRRITEPTHVVMNIYNMAGQKIETLVNANYIAGNYTISWNGRNKNGSSVPGRVYICQLQTKNSSLTRKMNLIK